MPVIVGREPIFTELDRTLRLAYSGKPQFIRILGGAGSGKTAVLDELCARAAPDLTVLRTRMSGPGAVERYRPIQELVSALVQAQPEPPAGLVGTLRSWCGGKTLDVAGEVLGLVPGLNLFGALYKILVILGRPPSAEQVSRLEHELSDRVSLARDLLLAAAHRPVLVVIDDLQWVDAGTEEVLMATLGALPKGRRLGFVCAVRHSQVDEPHLHRLGAQVDRVFVAERRGGALDLSLPGLQPADVNHLAADALGHPCAFGDDLVGWVCARAEGNPLRIRGLVATLYDRGLLDRSGPTLRGPSFVGGAPPERLRLVAELVERSDQAAAAELALLPGPLRRFLDVGATFGVRFPAPPVAELAGLGRAELLEVVSSAVARGLLRDDGLFSTRTGASDGALSFCSPTHHGWIAARVPVAVRRQLHADLARWYRPRVDEQRALAQVLWGRPQTEHVEALRRQGATALLSETRGLAGHLIGAGLQAEALLEQVRTAETLADTTLLGEDAEHCDSVSDRATTLDLLALLEDLGAGPFEAAIADPTADRDRVLVAEQAYHLCRARVWSVVGFHRRAAQSARAAVELGMQLGDDAKTRSALLRSAEVAASARELGVFRADLTRWRERAGAASVEELGAVLPLALHWPDTSVTRRTRRWLLDHGAAGPDRDAVETLVVCEALAGVDWMAPLSAHTSAHIHAALADPRHTRRVAQWLHQELDRLFETWHEESETDPPGFVVQCAAHAVAVLDRCRRALSQDANAGDQVAELDMLGWAFVETAHDRASGKALRGLPMEERREVTAALSSAPLGDRAERAARTRERFFAQPEPNPLGSWFPLLVRALHVDEVLPHLGRFLRAPYDQARAAVLTGILHHPEAASLALDGPLLEAAADLRRVGVRGRLDFAVAVALALAARGHAEARPLLASTILAADDGQPELGDEVRTIYRRLLAGERDGLSRSPRTTTRPPDTELPHEPLAAEREARRCRRLAEDATDPELATAWLRRAAAAYEPLPDGLARQDDVLEEIAETWDGMLQAWLEGDDDWGEVEATALDHRVHALREALAVNVRLGDHGRTRELQEELLSTLAMWKGELPEGTPDELAALAQSMVRSALDRGDLEHAADACAALSGTEGLEAVATSLIGKVRAAAQQQDEPWWFDERGGGEG